ncbi:ACT domain-containing protein ACR12 isoform X2 [Jatropha curcas]|uniref:ACT domain-containing protein ACR12 isoform X2 n=1 Tax=Jatropha curcas TaxID=180498 RepID=UPI0009D69642|nr:ACT domain-containing protein ACR12 isoform X2 [Jatropha curcas]
MPSDSDCNSARLQPPAYGSQQDDATPCVYYFLTLCLSLRLISHSISPKSLTKPTTSVANRVKEELWKISMSMALTHNFVSSSSLLTQIHRYHFMYFTSQISPPALLESFSNSFPIRCKFFSERENTVIFSRKRSILNASPNNTNPASSIPLSSEQDAYDVPMPVVLIDQDSDSDATIVQISFGDRLGALIDTMKALKELGLDVVKGSVFTEGSVKKTKCFITRFGRKVEDPDMLERIRLTIINNLLKYHPESSKLLAMGEVFGIKAPEKKLDVDFATHIHLKEDGPKQSLLYIETADRPGLLVEIIEIMADVNVDVESAEIETEGLVAKDKFHVSYRGAALNSSLSQVLVNSLRYYLRRPETDIDSY